MAKPNRISVVILATKDTINTIEDSIASVDAQSRIPHEKIVAYSGRENLYINGWKCLSDSWDSLISALNHATSKSTGDIILPLYSGQAIESDFLRTVKELAGQGSNLVIPARKFGSELIPPPQTWAPGEAGDLIGGCAWRAESIISEGCWHSDLDSVASKVGEVSCDPRCIVRGPAPYQPSISVQAPSHGIVITNYKRPKMLWSAFQSCQAAQVKRIVVSSSGVDDEIRRVHARIKRIRPDTIIVSEDGDSGCNMNWIRGLEAAGTKYATLLHDDDKVLPGIHMVEGAADKGDVGFMVWDGVKHGAGSENDGFYEYLPGLAGGTHDAKLAFDVLLEPNFLTLSPVGGAFNRMEMIRTLRECQANFGDPFFLRPSMMVGNDLMLWLRAAQQNQSMLYFKQPLVSYGHHDGSISFDDSIHQRGRLLPIYQRARKYFLDGMPKVVHLVPRYTPRDHATTRRIAAAEMSWGMMYNTGLVRSRQIWEKEYPRNSGSIGDPRNTPFLKDILQIGINESSGDDLIMLSNDDTLIHRSGIWHVMGHMGREEVGCSFRYNFPFGRVPSLVSPLQDIAKHGFVDKGRDLFAFRRDWLAENMHRIPDYVLGSTDWDSTLAIAFRCWRGIPVTVSDYLVPNPRCEFPPGIVMHEMHTAFWSASNENRKNVRGNTHNRAQSMKFIRENGVGWVI